METVIAVANATEMGHVRTIFYATFDAFGIISTANSAHAIPMLVPAAALPDGLEAAIDDITIELTKLPAAIDIPFGPALIICYFCHIVTLVGLFVGTVEQPGHPRVFATFIATAILEHLVLKPLFAVLFDQSRRVQLADITTVQ